MNILIIGSGGREHALAWKVKQSPLLEKLYCVPGNPGTAGIAENHDLDVSDFDTLIKFAKDNNIDLTIVGPENPLVDGIVDRFEEEGLLAFGPSKFAAQLEGSKSFSKDFMQANNIPTAEYATFTDSNLARDYILKNEKYPLVLKADGLAAGKGVLICQNENESMDALNQIMADKSFGSAGDKLVIEEFLDGDEVSIFVLCDGENYRILPPSQDHKKVGVGDTGKNTGGMGAYAPAPLATPELIQNVEKNVIQKTLLAMTKLGHPYRGLLYVGIIVVEGKPYVLEYNCRFGDPETQAVLPLVKSDLVPFFQACAKGSLGNLSLEIEDKCAVDVVLTSGGYPDAYDKGFKIVGLDQVVDEILTFHAGTKAENKNILTSGGRVLNLVALADTFEECIEKVYCEIEKISFQKMNFRRDIGFKVLRG
ncbi:MAG: phosphoribosylamine--glycine ligase [Calditrichaeota bacterium]|nr:MAG: phosphoribosylamine--glycine ligase [Calditrichota bacterium]MBL1203945.1 phosphoribosylamine--glycine ligase [Calditrichota bacterium]NOG43776.1 phosphoribosylamine--glycine ligase [Calditrichota bacterium]